MSRPIHQVLTEWSRKSAVLPQDISYFLLLLSGELTAIALSRSTASGARSVIRILFAKRSEAGREEILRSSAAAMIVLGMLPTLAWTIPQLNLFINLHIGFLTEVDFLLFVMGFLAGTAWSILLPQKAWLGLLLTPGIVFMTLVNVLSRYSW
ncbi:MAG: hypothetical protein OWS03_13325 [Alicyclobacillaceae bacterium]|uniref:hypothetical protein n=1 Tax=Alicyclobacillus sp. SP_1 TaxID=2942475 RepID=UPI0021586C04|nr:hypothetical protein [Alicyclobacillus sp. SP_1]MCY0897246.1 hypothetical protein [Alicyclobacillaceae bacterium]